jgi:hypothetical protein
LVGAEFQETLTRSNRVQNAFTQKKWPPFLAAILKSIIVLRRSNVLGRPGSDLLFQALRLSTIGAGEFNGRVRDGIGFSLSAKTTRPAKDGDQKSVISDQKTTEVTPLKQTGFSISPFRRLISDY